MHALAVTEQGAHLHAEGDLLLVRKQNSVLRRLRIAEIDQVLLFGRVEITSAAIAALARRNIDVVFLSQHGTFRARLATRASRNITLRFTQWQRAGDARFCLDVAHRFVLGKVRHQRLLLLRAQRRLHHPELADALGRLRLLLQRIPQATSLDSLRGLEGQAAALYFAHFGKLIHSPHFSFTRRTRRPPRDPVNACLSFGYALLTSLIETEVIRCGLDPMIGFFHQPAFGRPSLVLDLLEEFRPLIDTLVLRLINRRQLGPNDFRRLDAESLEALLASPEFPSPVPPAPAANVPAHTRAEPSNGPTDDPLTPTENAHTTAPGIHLDDPGRRIFLNAFFRRVRETLYYPPRQATLQVRQIIREQAYHLARVLEGKDDHYEAFVPR